MNPYEGVSFSTRPASRPSIALPDESPAAGSSEGSAPEPGPVTPPSFVAAPAGFLSACLTKVTSANRLSPVNLCSTRSKETTSPSRRRGHESARSFPENSYISSEAKEGVVVVPASSFFSSSSDSFVCSASRATATRPPYASSLVLPRSARLTVPRTSLLSTFGSRSSTVSAVTSSALALPSRSPGREPGAGSRATNFTSSPVLSELMPPPRTSEAWKNSWGPEPRLNPLTNPKASRKVTTTPYSHSRSRLPRAGASSGLPPSLRSRSRRSSWPRASRSPNRSPDRSCPRSSSRREPRGGGRARGGGDRPASWRAYEGTWSLIASRETTFWGRRKTRCRAPSEDRETIAASSARRESPFGAGGSLVFLSRTNPGDRVGFCAPCDLLSTGCRAWSCAGCHDRGADSEAPRTRESRQGGACRKCVENSRLWVWAKPRILQQCEQSQVSANI